MTSRRAVNRSAAAAVPGGINPGRRRGPGQAGMAGLEALFS
jgi:hypothetical protein